MPGDTHPAAWIASLAVLVIGATVLGLWIRARAFRWRALWRLRRIERDWRHSGQLAPLFQGLSTVLRETARRLGGERPVAGLSGRAWLVFLDEAAGIRDFTHGAGRGLIEYPYRDEAALRREDIDVPKVLTLVRFWLRHARPIRGRT